MKFKLSSLLLGITFLALVCGGLVQQYNFQLALEQQRQEFQEEKQHAASLSAVMAEASLVSFFYADLHQASPEELARRERFLLVSSIYFLARNERFAEQRQQEIVLMHAANLFVLLNVKDVEELRALVREGDFVPKFKDAYLDPQTEHYDELDDFLQRSFEHLRQQRTQPVRTWLAAVTSNDPVRLQSAFSRRVQEQSDDATWRKRLADYRDDLHAQCNESKINQFSYGYTTGSQDGVARLNWMKTEYRTFAIIKEGDEWKIDAP